MNLLEFADLVWRMRHRQQGGQDAGELEAQVDAVCRELLIETPHQVHEHGAFSGRTMKRGKRRSGLPQMVDPVLVQCLLWLIPVGESVIDLGAGQGKYVHWFRQMGRPAIGVDGISDIEVRTGGLVQWRDLAVPGALDGLRQQHSICLEVGEHVPSGEPLEAFLGNLAGSATDQVIVSWGRPGQRGTGHVSCRPVEWVVEELESRGLALDRERTDRARELCPGRGGWSEKLLVFRPAAEKLCQNEKVSEEVSAT